MRALFCDDDGNCTGGCGGGGINDAGCSADSIRNDDAELNSSSTLRASWSDDGGTESCTGVGGRSDDGGWNALNPKTPMFSPETVDRLEKPNNDVGLDVAGSTTLTSTL